MTRKKRTEENAVESGGQELSKGFGLISVKLQVEFEFSEVKPFIPSSNSRNKNSETSIRTVDF